LEGSGQFLTVVGEAGGEEIDDLAAVANADGAARTIDELT
jgi:hypothetical protein